MSLADICQAIQDTEFFTAMRESALVYPIVMSTHLTSIAVFGGLILMTDLRILGLAMKSVAIADMVRQTRIWKRIGFVIMVTCGILLAGSKLSSYYNNPYFVLKVTLLALVGVHAWYFRRSVYRDPAKLDALPAVPRAAKAAACLSLVLWTGILSAGRLIAYYEPPKAAGSSLRSLPSRGQGSGAGGQGLAASLRFGTVSAATYCAFTFWKNTSSFECVWPEMGSRLLTGCVIRLRISPHAAWPIPMMAARLSRPTGPCG